MRSRPWFWLMTVLTGLLALVIGVILTRAADTNDLNVMQQSVASYRAIGSVVRLSLIAILAICWPQLIAATARRGYVSSNVVNRLHERRWRIVAWLVAAELLIGTSVLNVIAGALAAVAS